jgi:glycosyltransferase involved in cell wall biosynthesis
MKIVHVHHYYYPVVGGIERAVQSLAEELVRMGHEVHVITSKFGAENRSDEERINGVFVHRVKASRIYFPDATYPMEYPEDVLKNADIIHGHSQNSLFTVKMIEKAKDLGTKTAMYFMAVDALNDHPNPLIRSLGPFYAKRVLKKAIALSDIKLVKSFRDLEILKNNYHVEAVYIPDGVNKEIVKAPSMAEDFREKYRVQDPFVVYIGRLHELKGIDILIKAMSIAIKEFPKLKAIIIGPGNQKPYLELAQSLGIEKNIMFLGYVDEETKIGALDASIALVLPSVCSYVEVFSIVISEAWSRNKPVIASAVGEIPYRVKPMVNGLLVQSKNPKALAEAIIMLMHDKELGVKLGSEGRKGILTWEEIAVKNMDTYRRSEELFMD